MHEDINDDGKLRSKWGRKKANAKNCGLVCRLTYNEYVGLVRQAGIKSSDIRPGGYHLARFGDLGNYEVGNCRFVPYWENFAERQPVDSEALSKAMLNYYKDHPGSFTGKSHAESTKLLIGYANSTAQAGQRNSQHGTCWITDGQTNRKVKRVATLPLGWRRGRVGPNVNQHKAPIV
jgi:hypothetical protein